MKHCIITGANSGIGRSAAYQIAEKGHAVVLACRNIEAAQKTCDDIKKVTGNDHVYAMKVDLSVMAQVKAFIDAYKARFDRLDVLINNAADFDLGRKTPSITAEGNEAQFATNVLAPHLLTVGLLDLMKKSEDARVINISSQGLVMYPNIKLDYDNIKAERYYSPAKTYYQNKLALLMLSLKMKEVLQNTNVSVHTIRVTSVKIDSSRYRNISQFARFVQKVKSRFAISADEMAKVYTDLALGEKRDGFCYDERLKEVPVSKFALIKEEQDKLWKVVEGQLK